MDYFLFTYPNCAKCEKIKEFLGASGLEWKEYDLLQKESRMKIREFLSFLKRDVKGSVIIPTLIITQDGEVQEVLNDREELEHWLKSRE